jgi:hypothetical protein
MRLIMASVLAAVALLAAPVASSAGPVTQVYYTFSGVLPPEGCIEESIAYTEDWHALTRLETTPGGVTVRFQVTHFHADAYGLTSGLRYEWSGGSVDVLARGTSVWMTHDTQTNFLHSASGGVRWYVHSVGQGVLVDGELKVSQYKATGECVYP